MENFKIEKRPTLSAISGLLLSIIPTEAKALEIPTQGNWYDGMQAFEQSANDESNEWVAMYAMNAEGEGVWTSPLEGGPGGVENSPALFIYEAYKKIGEITSLCDIHTHPLSNSDRLDIRSSGPSAPDIFGTVEFSTREDLYSSTLPLLDEVSPTASIVRGVATHHGIWYYEFDPTLIPAETTEFFPNDVSNAFWNNFENLELLFPEDATIPLSQDEAARITEWYETILFTRVRYVPYSNIQQEPPCAGVNYTQSNN